MRGCAQQRGPGCALLALMAFVSLSGCVATGMREPEGIAGGDWIGTQSDPLPERASAASQPELSQQREAWDLPTVLQIAAANNPKIAAARSQISVSAGRRWQAELYPNPQLKLMSSNVPTGSFSPGRGENSVTLTQAVIVGDRRRAAIDAASAARSRDLLIFQDQRRRILGQVEGVFAEFVYLAASEALHDELLAVARRTLGIAQARFEERAAPESEHLRAQVEVERLKLSRRRRGIERDRTTARFEALLGIPLQAEKIQGTLQPNLAPLKLKDLLDRVEAGHPRLLAAQREVEIASHELRRVRAERIPDIGVRVAYGHDGEIGSDFVNAGIILPLPIFNRNQGKIMAARHLLVKARKEMESVRNRLKVEVASAHASYRQARDQVVSFGESIIPAAEKALEQARSDYQAGRQSFLDMLDAQRTLAATRLALNEALRDLSVANATLNGLLGPMGGGESR